MSDPTFSGDPPAPSWRTVVLPYARTSPLHIPRRDLVLSASDSLNLRVTVVESDDPAAQALELTGGLGGPACTLLIYRDTQRAPGWWDYGAPVVPYAAPEILWSSAGVISDAVGSFDFAIPPATFANFPRRCGWCVRLDWDSGTRSEMLAVGMVQFVGTPGAAVVISTDLLTDTSDLVLMDDGITEVDAA